jgi:glucose/arabinose dehydrogenase
MERLQRKDFRRFILLSFLIALLCANVHAQNFPAGFSRVLVASGLNAPAAMAFAPDGRIFVCRQAGTLRVIKDGQLLPDPFVTLTVNSSGERGLIGIAFDPEFSQNGYVYLYYTLADGSRNRVSRFTANGDTAVPGSEHVILELDALSTASNHNGGAMHFDRDGKLYIAVGENATSAHAQNLDTYHGKILRINSDGSAPADNPFPNGSEQRKRVWAYGLRNPFTIDVQPGTGKLYVNDVGQVTWEEINDASTGGHNFGWPTDEGIESPTSFKNPDYAYRHGTGDGLGCAITGGVFFNPPHSSYPPEYYGKYFFMDLCGAWINYISPAPGAARNPFATAIGGNALALEIGPDGNLYYLSRSTNSLYKILYNSSQQPIITDQPDPVSVFEDETVVFSLSVSGAHPLSYQWKKNGIDIPGAEGPAFTITAVNNDDVAKYSVAVTNEFGSIVSDGALLTIIGVNLPPSPVIAIPPEGSKYRAGDVILYSGAATDPEDGPLSGDEFTWQVVFHHGDHFHDSPAVAGSKEGQFEVPVTGEVSDDVWYRLHLTARDANGRTAGVYRDIIPYKSKLSFVTEPEGLALTLDGQTIQAPYSVLSVEGLQREIGVHDPQIMEGSEYTFVRWAHGGQPTQTFTTPHDDFTYTAIFQEVPVTSLEIAEAKAVTVYPNPANGFIEVRHANLCTIKILDMTGREMSSTIVTQDRVQISLALPEGIYTMKIIQKDGNIRAQKLFITRTN